MSVCKYVVDVWSQGQSKSFWIDFDNIFTTPVGYFRPQQMHVKLQISIPLFGQNSRYFLFYILRTRALGSIWGRNLPLRIRDQEMKEKMQVKLSGTTYLLCYVYLICTVILLFFDVFLNHIQRQYKYLNSKLFQILTLFIHLSVDLTVIVNILAEYREYSASV